MASPQRTSATPRADAVARIRKAIDDGVFAIGTPLPSERDLARRLGLAQPTIHRALAVLEHEGTLAPVDGRIRLVRPPVPGALDHTIVILSSGRLAKHRDAGGYSDHLLEAAHRAASERGITSLAFNPRLLDDEACARLIAGRPLGVVLPDAADRQLAVGELPARLRAARIPLVACDDAPAYAACDRLVSDHTHGAKLLTEWLIARGRRRIATLWERTAVLGWWHAPRQHGYEHAMAAAGLSPLPPVVWAPLITRIDPWAGKEQAAAWLDDHGRHVVGWLLGPVRDQGVDAMMVHTDGDAFAVTAALDHLRADVDVVGYDAYATGNPLAAVGRPPLASIDKRYAQQGEALVALLMDRVEGRLPASPQVRLFAPELVVPRG